MDKNNQVLENYELESSSFLLFAEMKTQKIEKKYK